jgi:flagellum-specific ATP synthase
VVAIYRNSEDLINIGAYAKGSNPKIDQAISKIDAMNQFTKQGVDESTEYEQSIESMKAIVEG